MRLLLPACCLLASVACQAVERPRAATLGLSVRVPTEEEARQMDLPFEVRVQGQMITAIDAEGPASNTGLEAGDILLRIDENTLYSSDDLSDFLRAARPGDRVELGLRRAGTTVDETVQLELGGAPSQAAEIPVIDWEFASLAQLPRARAKAEAEERRLLVGLSGAET